MAHDTPSKPWFERRAGRVLLFLLVPVVAVVVWQVLADQGLISNTIPPPTEVARTQWHWMFGIPKSSVDVYAGTFWDQLYASGQRVLMGYLLAALVGIPLGVLIGASRVAYLTIDHVIQGLRTVPAPAWVPFTLAFFGLSTIATIWLIFLVAFFPIVVNTASGVHQVPVVFRNAARMLGASTLFVWARVLLPGALPFIFVGLRLGVGMAWIAVVVSELVGVKSGLGYSLYQAYQFGRMDVMIATMVTLGVLGLVSDRAVGLLAKVMIRN
jgi:NitT/TauT family transport system permease protein